MKAAAQNSLTCIIVAECEVSASLQRRRLKDCKRKLCHSSSLKSNNKPLLSLLNQNCDGNKVG